ncbi:MAG TPA: vWA domain-containing protein [Methylophilaceae bacterium]
MSFINPWALLLLPFIATPFLLNTHQGQMYSWLVLMPADRLSDMANLAVKTITAAMLACIVLALAAPQGPDQKVQKVGKGAQTVLVIDRSVSMGEPFAGDVASGHAAEIKSAAAKRLITKFIDSRTDDMMGVVAFTNSALYGVKITTNRAAIHSAINAATSAGINQTNIGAGVTEAISMFNDIPSTGSRAIILLSDGAGKISPRVKAKIQEKMTSMGLSLYWIVLREPDDISIFNKNNHFEPGSEPPAIELDNFFKSLKIKYRAYEAENPLALRSAIQDIDSREKNLIQYNITVPGHDYSHNLIILAMSLGFIILVVKNLRIHSWETA